MRVPTAFPAELEKTVAQQEACSFCRTRYRMRASGYRSFNCTNASAKDYRKKTCVIAHSL